jgi:hypothetical protein
LKGLEFFIFSHRVSAYVHLYWNSWHFRASFEEACYATALQKIQQRIRVADFSATHLRCRKFSNASALQKIQQRICVAGLDVGIRGFCTRCIRVAEKSATQMRC